MILVIGATGNVGRPLVAQLINRRALVRAVTRTPATTSLPPQAQIVQADPSKPETLKRALEGVTAIFLNARAVQTTGPELLTAAARAGVARAVALAASNVDEDLSRQPSRWRGDFNRELEQAVLGSGLEWVSLRPNEYASNYLTLWGAQLRRGDIIHGSYGDSQHAPIDERDIAAVAVEALLGDHFVGQKLTLTGPRSQSERELAQDLARVLQRPITYQEVPPEVTRRAMLSNGLPAGFVDRYLNLRAEAVHRRVEVTTTVEMILGRPANSFAVWATDHAAHFKRDAE